MVAVGVLAALAAGAVLGALLYSRRRRGVCSARRDCEPGQVCEAGECVAGIQCVADAECPRNRICTLGLCDRGKACTRSSQCAPGELCDDGSCAPGDAPCGTHSDCPYGAACYGGLCRAGLCRTKADCGKGMLCDTATGQCVPDGSGDASSCRTSDDCAVDWGCGPLDGRCWAPDTLACATDAGCPAGWGCFGGYCKPGCDLSRECAPGLACRDGECVAAPTPPLPPTTAHCTARFGCEPGDGGVSRVCDVSRGECVAAVGATCAVPEDCPPGTRCGPSGLCEPGCVMDWDCSASQRCDRVRGSCVAVKPATTPCDHATAGVCPTGTACTPPESLGHDAKKGACVAAGRACPASGDRAPSPGGVASCPTIYDCVDAHCKPRAPSLSPADELERLRSSAIGYPLVSTAAPAYAPPPIRRAVAADLLPRALLRSEATGDGGDLDGPEDDPEPPTPAGDPRIRIAPPTFLAPVGAVEWGPPHVWR